MYLKIDAYILLWIVGYGFYDYPCRYSFAKQIVSLNCIFYVISGLITFYAFGNIVEQWEILGKPNNQNFYTYLN